MCAEYEIRTKRKAIEERLGRQIINTTKYEEWERRIKFTNKAPLLRVTEEDKIELFDAVWPVRPFPNSRFSDVDDNVEVIRIYQKRTWREGFLAGRCIALATSFFEPVYEGEHAGKVMRFSDPKEEILFIPAIIIKAQVPKVEPAFSILTHRASTQMWKYHRRKIGLLNAEDAIEWASGGKVEDPLPKFNFLLKHDLSPKFKVEDERPMAAAWKKRVEEKIEDRKYEEKYVEALEAEGIKG